MDDDAWLVLFFIGRGNRRRRDEDLVAQQQGQSLSFCGGGGGPTSFGSNEAGPNALGVWDCVRELYGIQEGGIHKD